MSVTLRAIGLFGIVLFGILFSVTFASSELLEASAKKFIKHQIEKDVRASNEVVGDSSVVNTALDVAGRLGLEKKHLLQNIENKLPEKIANVIAAMCGYDCERKKAVAQSVTSGYFDRLKNIEIAQGTLESAIKGRYIEIVGSLTLDLRIFLGGNTMMFLILLLVSFFKPQAIAHLFLPGVLLLVATVLSSSIYLFGQDWFYTLLYSDYMGFTYLIYIAVIFSFLLDVVFNGARVTVEIVNAIANAIGSALSLAPC